MLFDLTPGKESSFMLDWKIRKGAIDGIALFILALHGFFVFILASLLLYGGRYCTIGRTFRLAFSLYI